GCQFTFITRDAGDAIEFDRFMQPITDALRSMGLDVRTTGRNDIALYPAGSERGYKISGNTQYKKNGVTVHHGTLLFDTDFDEMVRATTPKDYKITSKSIKSVRERVTNIRPHLPEDMTDVQFRDALAAYMTDKTYSLTEDDRARIRELAETKFADPKWNFGANPKFEIEHELHLPGGTVELGLTVKNGVIQSAGIRGDFFAADGETENLAACLTGTEYTADAVTAALTEVCGRLYGITAEAIVKEIFG
ncbi:MAG: lipoate--protein ligase, partial [Clostridia bacterium]|nr:lipoate--protein ligase [Clostridia bacterium]